ncbi:MAG: hypothetical protein GY820_24380 [Gammaproteobacteria bacterium]|nr:hypothetical protein [Gammaproteobacteria bacterium]
MDTLIGHLNSDPKHISEEEAIIWEEERKEVGQQTGVLRASQLFGAEQPC